MCVRYALSKPATAIAAIAKALARKLATPDDGSPRYNVTLTHVMPVVAERSDGPEVRGMRWGLVPAYERHLAKGRMLPNAKAETATTLSAFKQGIATRRCLVPANGFYEWQTLGKLKLPHLFTLKDEESFAFAGIWEPGDENSPGSYAILTTEPNALVAPIHNRMPVILTPPMMPHWLGTAPLSTQTYRQLTLSLDPSLMSVQPVSRFVSNSRHEGPQCFAPPEAPDPELAFS